MVRLEGHGRIGQRVGPGVVGADLVARRTVSGERPGHRRRSPLAVVTVAVALPLADAVGEGALEVLCRVRNPDGGDRAGGEEQADDEEKGKNAEAAIRAGHGTSGERVGCASLPTTGRR